jgi:hypothetical protein
MNRRSRFVTRGRLAFAQTGDGWRKSKTDAGETPLNQTHSNTLEFSLPRALLADRFDAEMDRLYPARVSPPPKRAGGMLDNLREMTRAQDSRNSSGGTGS